jgi:chemotaxis protein CheX
MEAAAPVGGGDGRTHGSWGLQETATMDVRYINPFMRSIKNVFQTMLKMDVSMQKPHVKNDGKASADVSGVIGFSGDATGCVVLSFPREVACKVASMFAGMPITIDSPDMVDAVGELANMVAGNAKKDFEGVRISISLPSVVIGHDHTVSQSRMTPRLVLPCSSPVGDFFVEVAMKVDKPVVVAEGACV